MIKESYKETVPLPEGVQVEIEGTKVTLKSGANENVRDFKVKGIEIKKVGEGLEIEARPAKRKMNAKLKTVVSHLHNMAKGLNQEFEYKMTIVYSHFPMSVNIKGNIVEINNFAGEKKMRQAKILPGVKVAIKGKDVTVTGHAKEAVGQTAANLETATKVRGRDRRVFQDGIFIVSKGN